MLAAMAETQGELVGETLGSALHHEACRIALEWLRIGQCETPVQHHHRLRLAQGIGVQIDTRPTARREIAQCDRSP